MDVEFMSCLHIVLYRHLWHFPKNLHNCTFGLKVLFLTISACIFNSINVSLYLRLRLGKFEFAKIWYNLALTNVGVADKQESIYKH